MSPPRLPDPRWVWEQPDPSRSGASGDLSKLFRNESVKQPGVFELDAPAPDATVMAREVIQNSWDAAIELQGRRAGTGGAPPFKIGFRYESVSGDHKPALVDALGLGELAERVALVNRHTIGLRSSDCLDRLFDGSPLTYLMIEERATTGMYGPWKGAKSKLYLALGTLGYTPKTSGEGGSYGYGKAGLIRGSAVRTVLAYTCFEEQDDDPGITRRFMGMTYWGQHDVGDESYTGFARFGELQADATVTPFTNEDADYIAESLGLRVRNPSEVQQLGTTFLLVEPTVDPDDLLVAIERNWWPALEGDYFDAVVEAPHGRMIPRPRTDPVLKTFIDAYELATLPQDNSDPERVRYQLRTREGARKLGALGLVADRSGWSYPQQTASQGDQEIDHCGLVALVRKPRMVVEYRRYPPRRSQSAPYVRGVFVADDEVNGPLQDTEPMGHDEWQTKTGDGTFNLENARLAEAIIAGVGNKIRDFRRSIRPPERPPEDIRLDVFDSLMRKVLSGSGSGRTGPTPATRPVRIRLDQELEQVDAGHVRVAGTATFSLSEHCDADEAAATVVIRYLLVEDDTARAAVPLQVDPPPDFTRGSQNGTHFEGRLTRNDSTFRFITEPYRADWTGRLSADADLPRTKLS